MFRRDTRFKHKIVKPKYFLILEDYKNHKKDIIAGLLTSKLWRFKASSNEGVFIKGKNKIDRSLFLWDNLQKIKVQNSVLKDFEIYDYCPKFSQIYSSLSNSKSVDKEAKKRLLEDIIPVKISHESKTENKILNSEQVKKIKKAFGFIK